MAGKWLHVSTDHAVINRTCHLQGKCICHPTVLAWEGLRFQSSVYIRYKCVFSLAKCLQSLWMCKDTTAWNTCVLRAMILGPVEIFRWVVVVCTKLYIPGGRISDSTRPLGGCLEYIWLHSSTRRGVWRISDCTRPLGGVSGGYLIALVHWEGCLDV
jgi:hypothetical protein